MGLEVQWEQANPRLQPGGQKRLFNRREQGGVHVHRFVCDFVAGVARWIPGFPRIQFSDPHSVAVRGDFVNCASISAQDRIVKCACGVSPTRGVKRATWTLPEARRSRVIV
jgi:hypothetical protein